MVARSKTGTLACVLRGLTVITAAAAGVAVPAALAAGGISLTPSVLERPATARSLGPITVTNTSSSTVTVTVTPRPWRQGRSGRVTANRRTTLLRFVRPAVRTFSLGAGSSRSVDMRLVRAPAGGALYGAVTVSARAPRSKAGAGGARVVVNYELVGALRATPARRRLAVRVAGVRARGSSVRLGVRNSGNVIDPISGSYRLVGARGTITGAFNAIKVLPGHTVDFRVDDAVPSGRYTFTAALRQAGRAVASVKRTVTVK